MNSAISKYGVGAKQAGMFLADRIGIFTRSEELPEEDKQYSEFAMSMKRMDELEEKGQGGDTYKGKVIHHPDLEFKREAGTTRVFGDESELRERSCDVIENIFNRFRKWPHWTILVLSDVRDDIYRALQHDSQPLRQVIVPTAAEMYHFYVHGVGGKLEEGTGFNQAMINGKDLNVEICFSHYQANGERIYEQDLKKLPISQDLIAKMMSYSCGGGGYGGGKNLVFEMTFGNSKSHDLAKKHGHFPVVGVLYYYPFRGGEETNPVEDESLSEEEKKKIKDGLTSLDDIDPGDLPAQREHKIFKIFWNGRLIPLTRCNLFNIPRAFKHHRIQGLIFLNETFLPSRNKLTFDMELEKILKQNGEINFRDPQTCLLQKGNPEKRVVKWVSACAKFDETVQWGQKMGEDEDLFKSVELLLPPNYGQNFKKPSEIPKEIPKKVQLQSNDVVRTRQGELARIMYFKKPQKGARYVVGVSTSSRTQSIVFFFCHSMLGHSFAFRVASLPVLLAYLLLAAVITLVYRSKSCRNPITL